MTALEHALARAAATAAVLLCSVPLAACEDVAADCTPTTTTARDAGKVDLTAVGSSSVLTGRLVDQDSGAGLGGLELRVTLTNGGTDLFSDTTTTGGRGGVSYDLLGRVDAGSTVALARADGFRLTFDGSGDYCGSDDDAELSVVGGGPALG